jgi:hypothetical protein
MAKGPNGPDDKRKYPPAGIDERKRDIDATVDP